MTGYDRDRLRAVLVAHQRQSARTMALTECIERGKDLLERLMEEWDRGGAAVTSSPRLKVMARRFLARTVHTACTDADLAWVDEFTRRTNPQIPEHAVMVWDPVVRVIRWEWDDDQPQEAGR